LPLGGKLRIIESVASYLLTALIVIFIILIATGVIRVAVVEGRSMEPTMHTGDLVLLEKKPPEDIKPGDVVVYSVGGKYIIHRVLKVFIHNGEYCYVVKGDNNPVPDPGFPECGGRGIPYDAIIGVAYSYNGMVVKIPYIGGVSVLLRG